MHGERRGQFQEIAITAAANVYASPRVAPLLVLGFASGLPLALTSGTLQAWATVENVPLQQIGFLTLVGTAYTLKFLWAPLVDRYAPPLLGRRRGWMLLTQVLLALGIMAMGLLSPSSALLPLALLAVTVAFCRPPRTSPSTPIAPTCCARTSAARARPSGSWATGWP